MAGEEGKTTVRRRRRLKGVEIRPEAVRQARLEAGLSLAGVAGSDLTRAAIHLIETGRARPSMPTLELIAMRTGKPVAFFLAPNSSRQDSNNDCGDARLIKVQEAAELGDFAAVLEQAQPLIDQTSDEIERARLEYWIGLAHVRLGQPDVAHAPLRRAHETFKRLGDHWMLAECMDAEAHALYLEHDPRALDVAEEALDLCRELDPRPVSTEARILGHLGQIHSLRNNWPEAISSFEEALKAAGPLRDLASMAKMYNGLSRVYDELGQTSQQLAYCQKALAVHSMLNDRTHVAIATGNLGVAFLKQGLFDEAEDQFRSALDQFAGLGVERHVSYVHLSTAELHMARNDMKRAEASANDAIELADRLSERLSSGFGHQLLGRIAAGRGEHEAADVEFELALAIYNEVGAEERVIECHSAYAEVLEARGDARRALWHARKALAISRPRLARANTAEGSEAAAG